MPSLQALGFYFCCVLAINGVVLKQPCGFVLSMGQGDTGQLGQGDEVMERKKPGFVKGLENVETVQIVAGGMHSLSLSSTGEVCEIRF